MLRGIAVGTAYQARIALCSLPCPALPVVCCCRRSYFHDPSTGTVTWEKPTGVEIVPPPGSTPAATSAAESAPPTRSWLQHIGTDGLPDLPSPPRPHNPNAPWLQRFVEQAHYSLVYSRKVSLAVAGICVVMLGVWSFMEHQKEKEREAARAAAMAAKRAKAEQRGG